jgi:hypothetical protein
MAKASVFENVACGRFTAAGEDARRIVTAERWDAKKPLTREPVKVKNLEIKVIQQV